MKASGVFSFQHDLSVMRKITGHEFLQHYSTSCISLAVLATCIIPDKERIIVAYSSIGMICSGDKTTGHTASIVRKQRMMGVIRSRTLVLPYSK